MDSCGESGAGRENSQCKGPEAEPAELIREQPGDLCAWSGISKGRVGAAERLYSLLNIKRRYLSPDVQLLSWQIDPATCVLCKCVQASCGLQITSLVLCPSMCRGLLSGGWAYRQPVLFSHIENFWPSSLPATLQYSIRVTVMKRSYNQ